MMGKKTIDTQRVCGFKKIFKIKKKVKGFFVLFLNNIANEMLIPAQ